MRFSVILFLIFSQIVYALDLYKVLDLDPSADERDIKRAYRTLSKKHHPDKNPGDTLAQEKFLQVSQAYEALSDPEQRKIYDRYGEEGLKKHLQQKQAGGAGGNFNSPFDMFRNFFGNNAGSGHASNERKGPNMLTEIEVDLKDIYTGRSFDFQISRKVICPSCQGSGARKPSDIVQCSACEGSGVRVVRHMLAPGMYQQLNMACDRCRGLGKTTKHVCSQCKGFRVIQSTNTLTLNIDRGLPEGSDVVFANAADESPDHDAGDVIARVRTKQSTAGWVRRGSHLYWKTTIGVADALLGFEKNLTHLDGHPLPIGRSSITQPNEIVKIEDEGLPIYHSSGFGDLYIEYNVVLPSSIPSTLSEKLKHAFDSFNDGRIHDDL